MGGCCLNGRLRGVYMKRSVRYPAFVIQILGCNLALRQGRSLAALSRAGVLTVNRLEGWQEHHALV
jgi:hypothetical protein